MSEPAIRTGWIHVLFAGLDVGLRLLDSRSRYNRSSRHFSPSSSLWNISFHSYFWRVTLNFGSAVRSMPFAYCEPDTTTDSLLISMQSYQVWGRREIYIISAVVYSVFQIPQAVCQNIQTMLVARFLAGIGGSTAIALVGGTLSDLFNNEDRSRPMAIFALAAFAPTGLGPGMTMLAAG